MSKENPAPEWKKLAKQKGRYADFQYPRVSVIVPTYNSDQYIALTLDSIFRQDYPDIEVLVVDAGSTDRTLRIVWEGYGERVRLCSVASPAVYEMLNKAISLSDGEYCNFLYPGDFYVQPDANRDIMTLALDHSKPDLVYGGSLIRVRNESLRSLFRPLDLYHLSRGLAPTSLPACWFYKRIFDVIGVFRSEFSMRANLDLLCRVAKDPSVQVVSTSRVYVDHEVRNIVPASVFVHFKETALVVWHHFGFRAVCRWLFYQRDLLRLLRMAPPAIKLVFFGKTEEK